MPATRRISACAENCARRQDERCIDWRKELAEPVMGVLKEQRGMRRFRLRGLSKVAVEFTLAVTALNLTRMWHVAPQLSRVA